jgi:hypothetical protein
VNIERTVGMVQSSATRGDGATPVRRWYRATQREPARCVAKHKGIADAKALAQPTAADTST